MKKVFLLMIVFISIPLFSAHAAYHHGGDTDSDIVLTVYPASKGSKIDSCALCHSGGEYEKKPGQTVTLGSCQWCHLTYGYDQSGDIDETLNEYGNDYKRYGKSAEALVEIASLDSDQEGYTNEEEISARRYPGNADDDPTKVAAPFKVVTRAELEKLDYHSQLMLMNTHKSGDFYAKYGGVTMSNLLSFAKMHDSATGITVFAPDGWAQYHPLEPDDSPLMYHVNGFYPESTLFFDPTADKDQSTFGWCDYSSPSLAGYQHGDPIQIEGGLQMLLAYDREGQKLQTGQLNDENKLDGEGPFRVVPPQKIVGPPDQSVKSEYQDVLWPFKAEADHNAGFATRSATIIKVEPLPEGTTDIDILEAGWEYVDEGKILIYGAIDPRETVLLKLKELKQSICTIKKDAFKRPGYRKALTRKIHSIIKKTRRNKTHQAIRQIERLSWNVDGCADSGQSDTNDWIMNCENQLAIYWTLHEASTLLK